MKTLENKIESYITKASWDIDYSHGSVKSIWGSHYKVELTNSNSCFDSFGVTYPLEQKIVLRKPCSEFLENTLADSDQEMMAYTLAHEVGHMDSYMITTPIIAAVMTKSLADFSKERTWDSFKRAVGVSALAYFILGEIGADACSYLLHDVPIINGWACLLPDIMEKGEKIYESFTQLL